MEILRGRRACVFLFCDLVAFKMLCIWAIFTCIAGLAWARSGPDLGPAWVWGHNALAGDVVDIFLALPRAVHVLLEADLFVARCGRA